jgi:general secretion pathway protein K
MLFLNRCKNNHGVALIITLSVVAVVVATALELNHTVRQSLLSAETNRNRSSLNYMATSGIHAAMAILAKDRKNSATDSVQEDWANPEKIQEVLQDIPFQEGTCNVSITDEMGKIQLNALVQWNGPNKFQFNGSQHQLWSRFLGLIISQEESLQDTEASMIINSIKDWIDSEDDDAITGLNGAESDYYEDLDPPYACKNDRFTYISELLLVRGVIPELFAILGGSQGLSSYLTVYGMKATDNNAFTYDGKININTADLPVLAAILPEGDTDLAPLLFEYRIETSESEFIHDLTNPGWYKDVPGFSDIEIDANLITTASDIFRIDATAGLDDVELTVTAIIQREIVPETGKWNCKVLNWQTG